MGIVIFLLVESVLIYSLIKFRARRDGPEPAQIRGNTPLEISWTIGAALILVVLAAVTFIYLPDIKDPPDSRADGLELAEGVRLRDDQPEGAAGRQRAADPRDRAAVPLALRLRGPGGPALQLPHAVRAGEHDGHAQGLLVGRRPLVVGAEARRQDRRGAGARERDLVPRRRGGHLRRRLRRALRRGPRGHAHARGRAAGRRVRGMGGAAGGRHQGGPGRPGRAARGTRARRLAGRGGEG